MVAEARRLFETRSVGHAGTLDPMASGVLVLLFGEATKLAPYLTGQDKEYCATVTFGRSTDTLDAEGRTEEVGDVPAGALSDPLLAAALDQEKSRTEQVPPAVSAISVDGERAHKLTRRGRPPVLAPRAVAVAELVLVERTSHTLTVTLRVSKGYYVRAFARDLGERLGLPSHLSALERLASGSFRIEEATPWPPGAAPELVSLEEAAERTVPVSTLTEDGVLRARQGKSLDASHFASPPREAGPAAWFSPTGSLVAIGGVSGEGVLRVIRGFGGGHR